MNKSLFFVFFLPAWLLAQSRLEHRIDSIVNEAIAQKAFPGAQVYIQKKGEVLLDKSYGYHTYDSLVKVSPEDVYDLASVTKIFAPTLALMKLYDQGKINLDQPFSAYWKDWAKKPNKKNLSFREILAHQAGLIPYIVYLKKVSHKNGTLKNRWAHRGAASHYSKEAFEQLYIKDRFEKVIDRKARNSKLGAKKYRYSGLTFLMYPRLIQQLSGENFTQFLQEQYYAPLGASSLGYLPSHWISKEQIVPTEYDSLFRKTLTQGWVHDENAALLGGISGNAGLFANTHSMVPVLQMLLQKGNYKGRRFLSEATVEEFTRVQFPENDNRRGLGFDKPLLGNDTLAFHESYPSPLASKSSYGHSGFTGTFFWVDPEQELIYIFLSNRVYPSRAQQGIYDLEVRKSILYQSLLDEDSNRS